VRKRRRAAAAGGRARQKRIDRGGITTYGLEVRPPPTREAAVTASNVLPEDRAAARQTHPSERRAFPRFPLLQRCLTSPPGTPGALAWHSIAYNISAGGIGITLPCPLRAEALLDIEAWNLPGAPRLRARVVHARFFDFLWFCGCELLTPLDDEGLRAWLSGSIDWVPDDPPARPF
jgi:hypothetical protein